MNYPLVMIEWEDSAQPRAAWEWLSSFGPPRIVRCVSVGWLIHDGDEIKAVAPNIGDVHDDEKQVSGVIQIPARCILRTSVLKVPKPLKRAPP